jgi:hypothetical protein
MHKQLHIYCCSCGERVDEGAISEWNRSFVHRCKENPENREMRTQYFLTTSEEDAMIDREEL